MSKDLLKLTAEEILSKYPYQRDIMWVVKELALYRSPAKLYKLAKLRPDIIADALKTYPHDDAYTYREEKIFLLGALYINNPQYDPSAAMERVNDRDRFVYREATIYLAIREDYKDCAAELMKNRDTQWCAERILSWRDEENSGIDARCICALAKKSIGSILWAFPAGIPNVHEGYYHRTSDDDDILADTLYNNCYLTLMLTAENFEVPQLAKDLLRHLNEEDLISLSYQVFFMWRNDMNCDDEKRISVLTFFAYHINDTFLHEYERYLDALDEAGESTLLVDALKALSLTYEKNKTAAYSSRMLTAKDIERIFKKYTDFRE
jgi:hypothetical protein